MTDPRLERIVNLESVVDYKVIPRDSDEFQDHLRFLSQYSGRYQENYSRYHIMNMISRYNRFNIGALLVNIDGQLSRSCMIENYKNWLLISRQITHEYPGVPIFTAYCYSIIMEIILQYNLCGVFATFNKGNKLYIRCIDPDFNKISGTGPIYKAHYETVRKIKKLGNLVQFMNTEQVIAYIEHTHSIKDIFNE